MENRTIKWRKSGKKGHIYKSMERYTFFKQFHDIPLTDYHLLTDRFQTRSFKKGDFITVPGQIQRELYFVKSGVQMAYFETGDKLYTLSFTYFPFLCAIAESFSFQVPSKYHLVCLTDSELDYITYADLQKLVDRSQQLERLFRRMTEAMFAGMIDLHIELRAMTIEERYKKFCRKSPHLLQLVPHKYIASYLGIDPTNFSKLFNNVTF
ncbi:cAMP-binding domain of CRP or a regulatory subunit of cAMP-dependent protein kinases [Parapedobacter indicus]|uniref:cAMP-binding domain of CRP or a regulatory subunit of cAMP-dependent protein kinases n=2 Tax=Parapedobacter indicus TaxID=1477437 RepID=A0A1I3IPV4_9SPHI|nr:CRP-like cAMP-binding protein [Parapedobacter indicus]SFI49986.1 cAMP-binding domain of CRP or a regulatory subunit of cAMP-dependent protein kinases [Parapedobacter indicus]